MKQKLSFLFFFLFSFQMMGMELEINRDKKEETPLLGANAGTHSSQEKSDSSSTHSSSHSLSEINILESDNHRSQHISEILFDDSMIDGNNSRSLFNLLNEQVFNPPDLMRYKVARWVGRVGGLLAEQAIIPMILYVALGLFDVLPGGSIDFVIIGLTMAYLLLPTVEYAAQMSEDLVNYASSPLPQVPSVYELKDSLPFPSPSSLQKFFTYTGYLHAAGLSIIFPTIFYEIEHKNFAWFFWGCVGPYALYVCGKSIIFYRQGQDKKRSDLLHRLEDYGARYKRKVLVHKLVRFQNDVLPDYEPSEVRDLYSCLSNPQTPVKDKLEELGKHLSSIEISSINQNNSSIRDRFVPYHPPSLDIKKILAREAANFAFYASLMSEFFLAQYCFSNVCTNFGLKNDLARNIISYSSAAIFNCIPFFFEGRNIQEYYGDILENGFGSSYSASNSIVRRVNSFSAFVAGFFIALSEVYPAWRAILSSDSRTRYPILIAMIIRHHARNGFTLQRGGDIAISNYHRRDLWRNRCFSCCAIDQSGEAMKDFISASIVRLVQMSDYVNANAIREIREALGLEERELII